MPTPHASTLKLPHKSPGHSPLSYRAPTHTHAHPHLSLTCVHVRARMCTNAHPHPHMCMHTRARTTTHAHTCAATPKHVCAHTCTRVHTRVCTILSFPLSTATWPLSHPTPTPRPPRTHHRQCLMGDTRVATAMMHACYLFHTVAHSQGATNA